MNYKVFIIGIELNSVVSKNNFESFLTATGSWKKVSDGFYIIKPIFSIESSLVLRDRIPRSIYQTGQLFVMRTSIDASWNVDANINAWLSANL